MINSPQKTGRTENNQDVIVHAMIRNFHVGVSKPKIKNVVKNTHGMQMLGRKGLRAEVKGVESILCWYRQRWNRRWWSVRTWENVSKAMNKHVGD